MYNQSLDTFLAVADCKSLNKAAAKVIRIGSSFLNPCAQFVALWNELAEAPKEYKIKIVPYSDDHDQILSVIASLGKDIDFLVGTFGSSQMLSLADFSELWKCKLCIAMSKTHSLSSNCK